MREKKKNINDDNIKLANKHRDDDMITCSRDKRKSSLMKIENDVE